MEFLIFTLFIEVNTLNCGKFNEIFVCNEQEIMILELYEKIILFIFWSHHFLLEKLINVNLSRFIFQAH